MVEFAKSLRLFGGVFSGVAAIFWLILPVNVITTILRLTLGTAAIVFLYGALYFQGRNRRYSWMRVSIPLSACTAAADAFAVLLVTRSAWLIAIGYVVAATFTFALTLSIQREVDRMR